MPEHGETVAVIEHAGAEPGPTVSVLAGIHGDEEEGVLAVQQVDAVLRARPPARGTVRTVAVAHSAAYAASRRTSPLDGLNLARCFPGDPAGTPTQRLAHALTEQAIRGSDLVIDLHSAGRDYTMPTFVGYLDTADEPAARAKRAAVAFGAALVWEHPPPVPPGRTVSAAAELGIPAIYAETSGGGSIERGELRVYVGGVLGVLGELDMLVGPAPARNPPRRLVRGGGDLDAGITAPGEGRFVAWCRAGDTLSAGDTIGEIVDDNGATRESVRAPADATVMFLRRTARIAEGEVVCSLAAPAVAWEHA